MPLAVVGLPLLFRWDELELLDCLGTPAKTASLFLRFLGACPELVLTNDDSTSENRRGQRGSFAPGGELRWGERAESIEYFSTEGTVWPCRVEIEDGILHVRALQEQKHTDMGKANYGINSLSA